MTAPDNKRPYKSYQVTASIVYSVRSTSPDEAKNTLKSILQSRIVGVTINDTHAIEWPVGKGS